VLTLNKGFIYLMKRNRGWLHMNSTDCTAPMIFLLAKHIISCNNATYRVFRPIIHCNHHINFYRSVENIIRVEQNINRNKKSRTSHRFPWHSAEVLFCFEVHIIKYCEISSFCYIKGTKILCKIVFDICKL